MLPVNRRLEILFFLCFLSQRIEQIKGLFYERTFQIMRNVNPTIAVLTPVRKFFKNQFPAKVTAVNVAIKLKLISIVSLLSGLKDKN